MAQQDETPTLKDQFAMAALACLKGFKQPDDCAIAAYQIANSMMRVRKKADKLPRYQSGGSYFDD